MATEDKWVPVVAYTMHHRIEGEILLLKGERLSDKLNQTQRRFEALRDARVFAVATGECVHEAATVALNKDHVTLLVPSGETGEA